MPTLEDVYQKFGFAAEAAQLLETELGNLLLLHVGVEEKLISAPNPPLAAELYQKIDKHTLGQLIKKLTVKDKGIAELQDELGTALDERNRLFHSFYRQHNFRRNSDEGRQLMLDDLDSMHKTLLDAYKTVMLLQGVDLDRMSVEAAEALNQHLPL
jgi:hypothetical protein